MLQLLRRATYFASEGSWSLHGSWAGSAAALPKRPPSAAPRSATSSGSTQRRPSSLLLELQLDVPERRALDLSNLQFALDAVIA
jgi:hypothetical protein